jgi:hypothetical protein
MTQKPRFYSAQQKNALASFPANNNRSELSSPVQCTVENSHLCWCGVEKIVEHIFRSCSASGNKRQILREASKTLDLQLLLDTKRILKAVGEFLVQAK